jgi:hypothetical protein
MMTTVSKTKIAIFQNRNGGFGRLRFFDFAFDPNATDFTARAIGDHLDGLKVTPLRRTRS